MYERALRARDSGESRWKSLDAMESDDLPPDYLENWGSARTFIDKYELVRLRLNL